MWRIIKYAPLADKVLFLLLIVLSASGMVAARELLPHGNEVVIEVDGKPAYLYPLSEDRTVTVESSRGKAVVEFRGNRVRVSLATCANRICMKQGWISQGTIVCLPNHIVVFVGRSAGPRKDLDGITG